MMVVDEWGRDPAFDRGAIIVLAVYLLVCVLGWRAWRAWRRR